MKRICAICGVALVVAGLCQAWGQEKAKSQAAKAPPTRVPDSKPAEGKPAAEKPTPATAATVKKIASPDDGVLREFTGSLAKAFSQHDAKAFAAHFGTEGEYVDEAGVVYHGRQAIEEDFAGVFKENPGSSIQLLVDSTRNVAPTIVAVDGYSQFIREKGATPVKGHFSFIAVKDGKNWFVASLRELADADPKSHHQHVQQLEWLVGEWIDEGSDSHVHFSCRWDSGGNYLIRDFEVHLAGEKVMTGTQRIGYDPITGLLKSWVFDSAGGYAEGYFHYEGESWVLHASGATADGRMASGANVFTPIDEHRMMWGAVDRVVGGERVADIPAITIVRKPPTPMPMPQR